MRHEIKNKLTDVTLVYVHNELFDAGRRPDDGQRQEGLRAVVEVETPDGFRWQHNRVFMSSKWEFDEEGFGGWEDNIELDMYHAQRLAERIAAHLKRGGVLNNNHWHPVQGVYGSLGWDEQAEIELEAQEF